jgi:hypothetical protein
MIAQAQHETDSLPYDVACASESVQRRYRELLAEGVSPRMAEMFALRTAPRVMTDSVYFAGVGTLDKQIGSAPCGQLDGLIAAAQAHGFTPGVNDFYDDGLADFFGDPKAFVPPTGGRNHVRRVCEERGVANFGPVQVQGRERENPPEPTRLAPDLAEEAVDVMIRANPELARVDRRELLAEAVHRHGFDDSKLAGELSKEIHAPPAGTF